MDKGGFCYWCGTTLNLHNHHIIYRSHLGSDEDWNIITLCLKHHERAHREPSFMLGVLRSLRGTPYWRWDKAYERLRGVYGNCDD